MPVSVYIDQNVFGHMLDTGKPWRETPIGRELAQPGVEVWIAPTHVVELLLLTSNVRRRQKLAEMMLDVCNRRRMGSDYGHLVVRELVALLNGVVHGACRLEYVNYYIEEAQRTFLGALMQLALGFDPPDEVICRLRMDKLVTRLLVARGKEDPDKWLDDVLHAVDNDEFIADDPLVADAAKSPEALLAEVEGRDTAGKRIPPGVREKLQKRRRDIIRAYATKEVAQSIDIVFQQLPCDLHWTFSESDLRVGWAAFQAKGCPPLATDSGLSEMIPLMVETCGWNVVSAVVAYEVVLREYEARFGSNEGTAKSAGMSFDADHAAFALCQCDVFVCHDAVLHSSASTIAKRLGGLGLERQVVSKPNQLAKAISAVMKKQAGT